MKIVICWAGFSGYLAACWRALYVCDEIDLHVVTYTGKKTSNAPFDTSILDGLPCHLLKSERADDADEVIQVVTSLEPDIIVIPGWMRPSYSLLFKHPLLKSSKFVMGMDTPWRGGWSQKLARWKVGKLVDRMDAVFVAGERTWQYARHLGVPESKLHRGVYGVDYEGFRSAYEQRLALGSGWPKRFLFVGRFVNAKGIDTLLEAYSKYREMVMEPWPLSCCGSGALQKQIADAKGVEDLGFVQPEDLTNVFANHGVFILPSRYEPWGAVLAEAGAAGMPIICTESCGAAIDLVQTMYNGIKIGTGDVDALARAMVWMHNNPDKLKIMGKRSQELASPYSAESWAEKWAYVFRSLIK